MRLYEHEGKSLLVAAGLHTPQPLQFGKLSSLLSRENGVLKAQTLFGNRFGKGLIQILSEKNPWETAVAALRSAIESVGLDPQTVDILVEPTLPLPRELYIALRYDTRWRQPVLLLNEMGGTGIEERAHGEASALQTIVLENFQLPPDAQLPAGLDRTWVERLIGIFRQADATLIEINPLVLSDSGEPLVLDAKIELDDTAAFRHPEWENYPPRTLFTRQPTANEQRAKAVNASDHRGVAGASYLDFDGTIGILASGGGASLLAMDSLLATNLKPANYTEYSGNPTREKVRGLAEVVLSKPNLEGLWIVGGHANFTDIYETLMGVFDAIVAAQLPEGFPIVVRRGGPRLEEAYAELKTLAEKHRLNLQLFDSQYPISDSALVLAKAVEQFRAERKG